MDRRQMLLAATSVPALTGAGMGGGAANPDKSGQPGRLAELLNRSEIFDLARLERYWRDHGKYDELANCYIPESRVRITWFRGTGKAFAEASARQAKGTATTGRHLVLPSRAQIKSAKALVESDATIQLRGTLSGVEFDLAAECRLFSRVVDTAEGWRLASFDCIYLKDSLKAAIPEQRLVLDSALLSTQRPSYRFMSYLAAAAGHKVDSDLPGSDRPELIDALYGDANAWLSA